MRLGEFIGSIPPGKANFYALRMIRFEDGPRRLLVDREPCDDPVAVGRGQAPWPAVTGWHEVGLERQPKPPWPPVAMQFQ